MPTVNKDGSITYSMEEFSSMQKSDQSKGTEGSKEQGWVDKWKEKMSPKKPAQQQQQQNSNPNQNGKPNQQQQPAGLTRDSLMEASKKLEFFKPTTEQLQKIQSGDMGAFMEAQQDALRNLFVDATLTSNTLVEGSSSNNQKTLERMVQEQMGRLESAKTIRDKTGDFFTAPGGDVMVSALTSQFSNGNPTATPAEIGDMVQGYLKDFSANFGQKETTPNAREVNIAEAQKSATEF